MDTGFRLACPLNSRSTPVSIRHCADGAALGRCRQPHRSRRRLLDAGRFDRPRDVVCLRPPFSIAIQPSAAGVGHVADGTGPADPDRAHRLHRDRAHPARLTGGSRRRGRTGYPGNRNRLSALLLSAAGTRSRCGLGFNLHYTYRCATDWVGRRGKGWCIGSERHRLDSCQYRDVADWKATGSARDCAIIGYNCRPVLNPAWIQAIHAVRMKQRAATMCPLDRHAGIADNPALRFEPRCVVVSIFKPSFQRSS